MAVTTKTQTLSKLGAHLRWYMEQCCVNPEKNAVVISVNSLIDQSNMIKGLLRDFDSSMMQRDDRYPHRIVVHGVPIWVMVAEKIPKEAA